MVKVQEGRLDPNAPLVLSTHELGRRPGSMRPLKLTVPAPAELGIAVIGVPEGSDLVLDLRMEAVMEGVLVSGTVSGVAVGECSRCLTPVEQDVVVDVQELFAYPGKTPAEVADDEDEVREVAPGELVDLEPTVRDAIVLELPFQPECDGPCQQDYEIGVSEQTPAREEPADPRWAALQDLLGDQRSGDTPSESREKS
ncbi:YceD family protein [Kineococcus rubinsiae]|uniref:YceD family protein n=1 Tax=Kineococcus rubinsiae TaxID=2609562 RepID=UPI001AD932F2|nr:YceD family protein [Kineococcus rubinsiae]